MKIFVTSFNRAENAISKLYQKIKDNNFLANNVDDSDYVLIIGDRTEQFDFALECYRKNYKIIHLWAGEKSDFELHDDVYRHSITLMSEYQLCTNNEAKERVKRLCKATGKIYRIITIGNIMLDNLEVDENNIPSWKYDLVLYNPPTRIDIDKILLEIEEIKSHIENDCIWLPPNGDMNSHLLNGYVNIDNQDRPTFLGLMKNCEKFITNSSCQYYEAPFLMKKENIISIGIRNKNRESKYSNMTISNASENVINFFKWLDK